MTGTAGNSEFCFPSTSIPFGFASGNIEGLGETKVTYGPAPAGYQVWQVVPTPNSSTYLFHASELNDTCNTPNVLLIIFFAYLKSVFAPLRSFKLIILN